jgi:hypothetical protein
VRQASPGSEGILFEDFIDMETKYTKIVSVVARIAVKGLCKRREEETDYEISGRTSSGITA